MSVSGTLGSMLQGVSQQPAHIRNDGQVTAQTNMLSDVVRGLTSRPGAELTAYNTTVDSTAVFKNIIIGGVAYQVGMRSGALEVMDLAGVEYTVVLDAGTSSYLSADMEVFVYNDVAYLLNRDQVTAMDSSTATQEALVIKDEALVSCLGGAFSHTYKVTMEYDDGVTIVGTYDAPDGTTAGDAEKTSSDYIADKLKVSLAAHGSIKVGTAVTVSGSVIRITGAADPKITVEDGTGGVLIRHQTNIVSNIEDLAVSAAHGTLVRVVGAKGSEDDLWMRFEIDGATVGASFGSEGIWQEWFNAYEPSQLDLTTMPHILTESGGTFTVSTGLWQGRRVGDSVTNPEPGFVGKAIRDLNGFQSRMVMIAGQHVAFSRTNIEIDFWKQSATAETASDPIDIVSTAQTSFNLEWIVPFDRDLIIFGDTSQFIITGNSALSPSNASLVQTTNFAMGEAARPASTGRSLLFPFSSGGFAGVKEFSSIDGQDASSAVSITQVQDEYMEGVVTKITASTNFDFVLVQTDSANTANTVFVHQFYFDGATKQQAAWSRWDFPAAVKNLYFEGSELHVLLHDDTFDYIQCTMNMDLPAHAVTGYPISLDLTAEYTTVALPGDVAGRTYIDTPHAVAKLVQSTGCVVPGQTVASTVSDEGGSVFTSQRHLMSGTTAPVGSTVLLGVSYTSSVMPTMPFLRDKDGAAIKLSKLVVTEFVVYYEESGYITTSMTSKYRSQPMHHTNAEIVTAFDPDDPNGIGVRSGSYTVPWGERSDWSEIMIASDDVRPLTITEVEWLGQPLSRGRRL